MRIEFKMQNYAICLYHDSNKIVLRAVAGLCAAQFLDSTVNFHSLHNIELGSVRVESHINLYRLVRNLLEKCKIFE